MNVIAKIYYFFVFLSFQNINVAFSIAIFSGSLGHILKIPGEFMFHRKLMKKYNVEKMLG